MSVHLQDLVRVLECEVRWVGVSGRRGFLLVPSESDSRGKLYPWVWFAPTFLKSLPNKTHAWMFRQFLRKGVAIAGIEIGETFGSPEGRAVCSDFHNKLCDEFGLASKACLLVQSRGALMLYNWAVEHPDEVACIAGIYPACDLRSYPGLERAAGAYGLSVEELRRDLTRHNPIDRLAPLADAKVPIRHIHGNADSVVPLAANTAEVTNRYRAMSGEMDFIVVDGKGHEDASEFFERRELVDFIFQRGLMRIHWM